MSSNIGPRISLEGEKNFKQALADINQSFRVLGSEMKLAASEFDRNEKSVASLTSRNNELNKQMDVQREKIGVLRAALENAAESFGENDRRTQNWQIQLNNAEAVLNTMEREVVNNEKAINAMGDEMNDTAEQAGTLSNSVEASGRQAEDAGGKFETFKGILSAAGAAAAAAVAAIGTASAAAGKAIWDMANDTAAAGDNIDKMSQKIGISAEAYQEWAYVFERSGANVDNLQAGMKTLSGVITDAAAGSASAAEKLSAAGLSLEQLNGLSQEQQLDLVISALQGMEQGAQRTSAATDLLGRSATDMAAVLNMTAGETSALKQEAQDYGMVMSSQAVAASADFEDSLTRMQGTISGVKNSIAGEFLPGIAQIMDGISELAAGNDSAGETIQRGAGSVIAAVSDMIPQTVDLIRNMASAVLEVAPAIVQSLAGGIISAIPEFVDVIVDIGTELVTALTGLLPLLADAGVQIAASLVRGLAEAAPELLDTGMTVLEQLTDGILNGIPEMTGRLPEVTDAILDFLTERLPVMLDKGTELLGRLGDGVLRAIPELVSKLPQIISSIVDFVSQNLPKIAESGVNLLGQFTAGIIRAIPQLVASLPQLTSAIVQGIGSLMGSIVEAGRSIVQGIWQGISAMSSWIREKVTGLFSGIVSSVKGLLGIHSPSRVFADIGENMALGLGEGFSGEMTAVRREINDAMNGFTAGMPPDIRGEVTVRSTADGTGGTAPSGGLVVHIGTLSVREEADVDRIARQLFQLEQLSLRGRGVSYV